ncbi:MAG TPA: hypothetical protein PKX91_05330 [Clostridia bacterium]|jgi:hypothetical protein|nr:hypothetical protein [Clostridia bacterium]
MARKTLKKGIYSLVVAILVTMIFLGLYGCENPGIEYTVGFSGLASFGSKENADGGITYGLTKIIKSVEELKATCEEWNNSAYDKTSDDYSSELSQTIRRYDEKFFETNALIVNSSVQYNSAREPEVEKVMTKGNELIVQISSRSGTYEDIAESWIFIIEINKASINGVTGVTIKNTTRSK